MHEVIEEVRVSESEQLERLHHLLENLEPLTWGGGDITSEMRQSAG